MKKDLTPFGIFFNERLRKFNLSLRDVTRSIVAARKLKFKYVYCMLSASKTGLGLSKRVLPTLAVILKCKVEELENLLLMEKGPSQDLIDLVKSPGIFGALSDCKELPVSFLVKILQVQRVMGFELSSEVIKQLLIEYKKPSKESQTQQV